MTFLKMRHFAILGITAITIVAIIQQVDLTQLIPVYGIMISIVVGDKVLEKTKSKK